LAISKQRKDELVAEYTALSNRSQAVIISAYTGMTMAQIDDLRAKVREAGGEFHIVKNTLGRVAFKNIGMDVPEKYLEGSTAVTFAFNDPASMAKVLTDFSKTTEFVKIKGGLLGKRSINPVDVKALAELPPLPVLRAQLLGTLQAPASKLVRTLAEPARSMAAVLKAHSEQEAAPAAAPAVE
jgi:large subunit ribosomal protein L10